VVAISNEHCVLLVNICFYGQDRDDKWYREDNLYPWLDIPFSISIDCDEFARKNGLLYSSWGIDSRVYVCDGRTNEITHIGNMLFLDFDDVKDIKSVYNKIALLIDDGLISSTPDIVRSKHGFHCYFYEVFDFSEVRNILLKPYISDYICDAFFRTTLKLKCSVLRLSKWKKGEYSPLELIEFGDTEDDVGKKFQLFVRSALQ
jgi:hypothetical protein